jgi:hypothetical protein
MVNLQHLAIARHIPLDWNTITHISFRLHTFITTGSLIGPWVVFIGMQDGLEEIRCDGDFFDSAPRSSELPLLRRLKAREEDAAKFASYHPLQHLWIRAGTAGGARNLSTRYFRRFCTSPARLVSLRISPYTLLRLLSQAQAILATLRSLVLDEDGNWHLLTLAVGTNRTW